VKQLQNITTADSTSRAENMPENTNMKDKRPVRVICFSKDRPFQLKEYLRSLLSMSLDPVDVSILYKDSDRYAQSYERVKSIFPTVHFVRQSSFFDQVLELVSGDYKYIQFDVDDSIYYREFRMQDAFDALADPKVLNFQWGMHPACNLQQTSGWAPMKVPQLEDQGHFVCWSRTPGTDSWNWPFKLTASVYRKEVCVEIVRGLGKAVITTPNSFEMGAVKFSMKRWLFSTRGSRTFAARPLSACPKRPVSSCIAINVVQNNWPSRTEGHVAAMGPERLDILFAEGKELDLDYYRKRIFNSSHIGDFVLKGSQDNS
jgi:hypothetical protein